MFKRGIAEAVVVSVGAVVGAAAAPDGGAEVNASLSVG